MYSPQHYNNIGWNFISSHPLFLKNTFSQATLDSSFPSFKSFYSVTKPVDFLVVEIQKVISFSASFALYIIKCITLSSIFSGFVLELPSKIIFFFKFICWNFLVILKFSFQSTFYIKLLQTSWSFLFL